MALLEYSTAGTTGGCAYRAISSPPVAASTEACNPPCEGIVSSEKPLLVPGPAAITARTLDLARKLRRGTEIDRCRRIRLAYELGRDCAGAYNVGVDSGACCTLVRIPKDQRARIFVFIAGAGAPFYTESKPVFDAALRDSHALTPPILPVGGGLETWTEFSAFCAGAGIPSSNFQWQMLPTPSSPS